MICKSEGNIRKKLNQISRYPQNSDFYARRSRKDSQLRSTQKLRHARSTNANCEEIAAAETRKLMVADLSGDPLKIMRMM